MISEQEMRLRFQLPQEESCYWECAELLRKSLSVLTGVRGMELDVRYRSVYVYCDPCRVDPVDLVRQARQLGAMTDSRSKNEAGVTS